MGLVTTDYIILAGFFVIMLAVGIFYANRMHNLRDFFSGSRQVPWWLAGISLYMTTFSAFTFVAYSAIAYEHGFVAVTVWWFSIPGCILSARFLAARWRRAATTSPLEYLETRYGGFLRQAFSWFGVPLIVMDDALKLLVIGTMLTVSIGLDDPSAMMWVIVISGSIILGYTLLGGLWAVLITDCIQFIVMATAVLVLLPLATRAGGGFSAIMESTPESFFKPTSGTFTWPWLLSFSVILALTYATKWPYVQRYYAAGSDRDARRVGYLVGALTLIGPPLLFWPAVAARVFLPEVVDTNTVYPMLCRTLLPAGLMGIVIAAMFSATMSMLSSDYNAVASVVTNDIIKRIFLKKASDKTLLLIARGSTLLIGGLAMVLAIILANAEGLEDLVKIMAKLFSVLLPPVALPMMAGLLSKRASERGAILGFVLGAVCGCGAYALSVSYEEYKFLAGVPYLSWITILPTAAGLVFGSLLFPDKHEKQAKIHEFLGGLTSHMPHPEKGANRDALYALGMVGGTCGLLGLLLVVAVMLTASMQEAWLSFAVGVILACGGGAAVLYALSRMKTIPEKTDEV